MLTPGPPAGTGNGSPGTGIPSVMSKGLPSDRATRALGPGRAVRPCALAGPPMAYGRDPTVSYAGGARPVAARRSAPTGPTRMTRARMDRTARPSEPL
ncbi:hypothetical protein FRACA_700003 [Frankia canadensis]|uniref:Uncharacterized protein n=1 Tax=Frankia canadensis TaxID=1836972 RepID=A0A2I2L0L6_9ACTN|nr:hypothetical protein FRACA_700003 [Frankia canadensis]SOU58740.1 hypothetical protein FRACA_700003 [Frankia canadensis]